MYIDSHVHLRDFKEKHKETIQHGLEVARDSGVDAVFDMPNTNPPTTTEELVDQRLALAIKANVPEVFYGLFLGITRDREQIKMAVDIFDNFQQVVGVKVYLYHSVGNLGVICEEDQEMIYDIFSSYGFNGVMVVHAEKGSVMHHDRWNHLDPITHCHARPERSEVYSVRDQIRFAKKYNFKGKLHIAHISSPRAVDLVNQAKNEGLDISCGICPHHFIYDWNQMAEEKGILWKMNPPLRSPDSRSLMLDYLKEGKIDWIETDHAPHTLDEKIKEPFMSGIPGLPWWNLFEEFLRKKEFSDEQIEKLTFTNIAERFNIGVVRSKRKIIDRKSDYPFNPYEPLEKLLKEK